jgi:hypothetical protein
VFASRVVGGEYQLRNRKRRFHTVCKHHEVLPDFPAALAYVKAFRARGAREILRLVNPTDATDEELREHIENGATIA